MTSRGTTTNHALRRALLHLLASGRAITTAELRARLTDDSAFTNITQEAVYRHLEALSRAGRIRRVANPGRRHVFWTRRPVAISASLPRERQ